MGAGGVTTPFSALNILSVVLVCNALKVRDDMFAHYMYPKTTHLSRVLSSLYISGFQIDPIVQHYIPNYPRTYVIQWM